jgi:hypothetical protein
MYGEDVTDRFTSIQTVDGNLTVYPLPITVWTGSAVKGYDGTPLTEDAAAILETDAAVNPAPRSNLGYVDAAEAQECLYILTGTVTVYAANPITGDFSYGIEGFWLSTAHHAKFREVIADTLGREFPIPEGLQVAMRKQKHFHPMDVSVAALEDYIVECVRE